MDFDELEHTASGVKVQARMYFSQGEQHLTVPVTVGMETTTETEGGKGDRGYS